MREFLIPVTPVEPGSLHTIGILEYGDIGITGKWIPFIFIYPMFHLSTIPPFPAAYSMLLPEFFLAY